MSTINTSDLRFWEDAWVGDTSLAECFPLRYRMSNSHDARISSLYSYRDHLGGESYPWKSRFLRRLNDKELEQVSELIMVLDSVQICNAM